MCDPPLTLPPDSELLSVYLTGWIITSGLFSEGYSVGRLQGSFPLVDISMGNYGRFSRFLPVDGHGIGGYILCGDLLLAQDDEPFEDVTKLPYITVPVDIHQFPDGSFGEVAFAGAIFVTYLLIEEIHEQGDIFLSLVE